MVRMWGVFILGVLSSLALSAQASDRPNVVVIVADDLGWADVGFHGNQIIDTPSLDRIAAEGAQLNRFYTTPICSPTRAALMTGRDPIRLGVAYSTIMPGKTTVFIQMKPFCRSCFSARDIRRLWWANGI